ncbi:MAG: hypothetical protein HKP19_14205 [Xanthomonadales bacterium]|nr:hypothetical protein [Xanthomonadales bacterium]
MNIGRPAASCRALALLACCALQAAAVRAADIPLFEDDSLLEIELKGPLSSIIDDRSEREERPFVLVLDAVEWNVQVRLRGHSRSRREVCIFPPLRLRFENAAGLFEGQKKLKLVTHCQNSDRGDAEVMEEYAAYRLFNLLSQVSFRVRPLRITYTDTDGRLSARARQRFGFVIEPAKQLERRSGGSLLELSGVSLAALDPDQAALVYVFQYLIGNTDWSLVTSTGKEYCCHNGLLLGIDGRVHYVPYDFDLAGLVNTRYAKPHSSLRLRSVRIRRYRGFCTEPETLLAAIRSVSKQEDAALDIMRTAPALSEKDRAKGIDYLSRFFEKARDENRLLVEFDRKCLDPRTGK